MDRLLLNASKTQYFSYMFLHFAEKPVIFHKNDRLLLNTCKTTHLLKKQILPSTTSLHYPLLHNHPFTTTSSQHSFTTPFNHLPQQPLSTPHLKNLPRQPPNSLSLLPCPSLSDLVGARATCCITFVHHFSFNSCSAVLCVLPISNTTWAPCSASVLVQNVLSQIHSFCTSAAFQLILFVGLLVSAACSLRSHSTDCQHTHSRIADPKQHHLPDVSHSVSSLHMLASTAGIHGCGQACRQKLLASTSYSTWLHPQNGFAPCRLLQMVQLLQFGPCPGWNDKAFSQYPSLGNCSQHIHSVVASSRFGVAVTIRSVD